MAKYDIYRDKRVINDITKNIIASIKAGVHFFQLSPRGALILG